MEAWKAKEKRLFFDHGKGLKGSKRVRRRKRSGSKRKRKQMKKED
jgi:hypothetical protein